MREDRIGAFPCLAAGSGPPLVVLAGLTPQAGVAPGPLRRSHEATARLWAAANEVFYVNLRSGLPRGMTMSDLAAELAAGLRDGFDDAVDVLGMSTGGSIAQQLAAEHPDAVRRLVLLSTGCRLGPEAKRMQRQVGARVRAGAYRRAMALMAADLVPPRPLRLPAALGAWIAGPRLLPGDGIQDMATMIEAEDGFELARLPTIGAPTLLIGGGRDRFYDAELLSETAALIPGCRLEIVPGRGHITVLQDRRARASVGAFLADPT